ncbi:MAG: toprim domain-containing protein [Candidatus Bathyarchaeia archaeon]
MSTHLKEKAEQIQQILEQLAEEARSGKPILVEGRKDEQALKTLGITGKIIFAKKGLKTLLDVISEIETSSPNEVILMLDFDREGRELTEHLKTHVEKAGVKVNLHYWLKLSNLTGREIKDVEGLAKYMETLKEKSASPTGSLSWLS